MSDWRTRTERKSDHDLGAAIGVTSRFVPGVTLTFVAVVMAVCITIGPAPTAAAAPIATAATTSQRPTMQRERYLLALGDSISFGFQGPKLTDPPNPSVFNTGYVDVLASRARSSTVTNFSCPGETTTTFVSGGCPWRESGFAVHDSYRGSQLAAAVTFLRAHRRHSGTVTVSLWGNDIGALRNACSGDLACVAERAPAEIAVFSERLLVILRALRRAAPSADIAVLTAFHAFPPPTPEIDALYDALNQAIVDTAARAGVLVADARPTFNPPGDAARSAALCKYTLVCATGGADGHPSNVGYARIADVIARVTRCTRQPGSR